jgi:LAO/AO transport system kinase
VNEVLQELVKGDARALARVITQVENRTSDSTSILQALFPYAGGARIVGVTGSPGAGKSSLVDRLTAAYRRQDKRVGIVAVDPSSPFSGGAILGDRIRMQGLGTDPGVYIRSMAGRGHLGGLAAATADVVSVIDAAGRDPILVETVGVGQDEIEIVKLADVSVVVLVPGMGDDIQALKAGIMEIADIFVINKADRPGVDRLERTVQAMLALASKPEEWIPPIIRTIATKDVGIEETVAAIDRCHHFMQNSSSRLAKRREAARRRVVALLEEQLLRTVLAQALAAGELEKIVDEIANRTLDPHAAVQDIMKRVACHAD